ncbi:hypothetical protein roselon_03292 [Roseibacterium elongatum DSM 19469]|uniref:Uncharacterized protein n=1 Tax=Roseicyclus elongatus DSM 19469 TaxID=1294273 RepID=W8SSQ6_9RHOB|nr:hypothetical protein [Roseibacterium elongatum]AHM05550.1 hypothetical protein roselon_03292 [Roseibacterium elongatum DSM 19469]
MRFARLAPALAALALPAQAQVTGYEWVYLRDIQANPMETVMALTLGVPETDDVVLQARCELTSGPQVSFDFAADPGPIPLETDVSFTVTPEGLSPSTVPATTRANAFIGGVFIDRAPTDPFNLALAAAPVLSWGIDGQPAATVDVSVNQHLVGRFLYECAHFGDQQPDPDGVTLFPAGGGTAAAQSGTMACDMAGQVVSTPGGTPQAVTFVNATEGGRGLAWVAPDGSLHDMAFVEAGASARFGTTTGDVWMILDGPGNCLEMYRPVAGVDRVEIARPAEAFGEE